MAVLAVILIFAWLRIELYGNPALSIAGNDTPSYVESGRVPLLSAEIMTGRRLLTTNLVYKILEPPSGYEILVNGSLETTRRVIQPGFDRIVILQLILSLLGWGMLAWFVAETLRDAWLKIVCAVLILSFGFTPQIADWDSILMSESLTFSLFTIQFALIVKIAFMLFRDANAKVTPWVLAWGFVFFFWTFLRDTNLFTSLMTIAMIAILFISPRFRLNKTLTGVMFFLSVLFILGLFTAGASVRSLVQIRNLYKDDIFPNPTRVAILQETDAMPLWESPEFEPWLEERGSSAILRFMLTHPGYPATKILKDFPYAFTEIEQTYFTARDLNPAREVLFEVGNALHPENTTPFFLSLLFLAVMWRLALKDMGDSRLWMWLGIWLFATASLTLIPTILGDTWALNRHALYSTTIFRLMMWVYPILLADIALTLKQPAAQTPT